MGFKPGGAGVRVEVRVERPCRSLGIWLFSVALSVRRPAGIGLVEERGLEEARDGVWILALGIQPVIDSSLKLMGKAARRVVRWRLGWLLGSLPSSGSGGHLS